MLVVWCDLCLLCGGACACCVLGFVLCMVGPVFVVWRGLCLLTVWWGLCLLCGGRLCLLCGRGLCLLCGGACVCCGVLCVGW